MRESENKLPKFEKLDFLIILAYVNLQLNQPIEALDASSQALAYGLNDLGVGEAIVPQPGEEFEL